MCIRLAEEDQDALLEELEALDKGKPVIQPVKSKRKAKTRSPVKKKTTVSEQAPQEAPLTTIEEAPLTTTDEAPLTTTEESLQTVEESSLNTAEDSTKVSEESPLMTPPEESEQNFEDSPLATLASVACDVTTANEDETGWVEYRRKKHSSRTESAFEISAPAAPLPLPRSHVFPLPRLDTPPGTTQTEKGADKTELSQVNPYTSGGRERWKKPAFLEVPPQPSQNQPSGPKCVNNSGASTPSDGTRRSSRDSGLSTPVDSSPPSSGLSTPSISSPVLLHGLLFESIYAMSPGSQNTIPSQVGAEEATLALKCGSCGICNDCDTVLDTKKVAIKFFTTQPRA